MLRVFNKNDIFPDISTHSIVEDKEVFENFIESTNIIDAVCFDEYMGIQYSEASEIAAEVDKLNLQKITKKETKNQIILRRMSLIILLKERLKMSKIIFRNLLLK